MTTIPITVEQDVRIERANDTHSPLLKDSIIFIRSKTNDNMANSVFTQPSHFESEKPETDQKIR